MTRITKPSRSLISAMARVVFATIRRVRHAWMSMKVGTRMRRARARIATAGSRIPQRVTSVVTLARQLAYYHVPGEQRRCPACGGASIHHLQVLGYARPLDRSQRYGFMAGCERCGVVFANPLPALPQLDALYTPEGKWGQTRPDREPPVSRDRLARLFRPIHDTLDVMHPPQGASVLDFGCGLGGMLDTLAASGWVTHGIDPGTKVAFDRHRELPTIPDTPQFDLVILHHVLEHVIDPSGILTALARATRPGGHLLVSVPNLDSLLDHGDMAYCLRSTTHVLAYSRACLTWLLAEAGFRVIEEGVDSDLAASPRQVVLARREDGSLPHTADPLGAARSVLARYHARRRIHWWGSPHLPVRVRAAMSNLWGPAFARQTAT